MKIGAWPVLYVGFPFEIRFAVPDFVMCILNPYLTELGFGFELRNFHQHLPDLDVAVRMIYIHARVRQVVYWGKAGKALNSDTSFHKGKWQLQPGNRHIHKGHMLES